MADTTQQAAADGLIEDLGKVLAPLGYDAERIRAEVAARKAQVERHNARAHAKNEAMCKAAIGKTFKIRTSKTSTIEGVITEARMVNGRAEVYILQSGTYRHGPYYVKALPR